MSYLCTLTRMPDKHISKMSKNEKNQCHQCQMQKNANAKFLDQIFGMFYDVMSLTKPLEFCNKRKIKEYLRYQKTVNSDR